MKAELERRGWEFTKYGNEYRAFHRLGNYEFIGISLTELITFIYKL